MRYKIGAEQLQQVPPSSIAPTPPSGPVELPPPARPMRSRPGPARPPVGSRPRGWRCWTKTGNKPASSRTALGASPPSWPTPATSRIALVAAHDVLAQGLRRSHQRRRDSAGNMARSKGRTMRRTPISPGRQSLTHSGVLHDLEGAMPTTTLPIFCPVLRPDTSRTSPASCDRSQWPPRTASPHDLTGALTSTAGGDGSPWSVLAHPRQPLKTVSGPGTPAVDWPLDGQDLRIKASAAGSISVRPGRRPSWEARRRPQPV